MSRPSATAASHARAAAPLFAALGDETRLQLVLRLSRSGPESTAGLSAEAAVTRQAIAKHLEVLTAAGLVQGRRVGRERLWALQPKRLADAREYLDRISQQWDGALGRLRTFVET
jgi:DNA-binding transcriptional ArsR family regulator